jgi:hypothetical protein
MSECGCERGRGQGEDKTRGERKERGRSMRFYKCSHLLISSVRATRPCFMYYVPQGKVKIKLSLCLIKHHTIRIYEGVEVYVHTFLTSALGGGE